MSTKTIILAGGSGSRMKSKNHKVLHKIYDKTLLDYVVKASCGTEIIVVVGHQADNVKNSLGYDNSIQFALQSEQLGTGHAVMMAKEHIDEDSHVFVLCGDTPLLTKETLDKLLEYHIKNNNAISLASTNLDNPTGYGRIIRRNDKVVKITEHKDLVGDEVNITEVNTGVYCFQGSVLKELLAKISNNNSQNEYYLTDTLEIACNTGYNVGAIVFPDYSQFVGINTKLQLHEATKLMQQRINNRHMENGVIIVDSNTSYIGDDVVIGMDTVIYPNSSLFGKCVIGEDCEITGSKLEDMVVGDSVTITNSVCVKSSVGSHTSVGPFAYIRPDCQIGEKVKIGDFVEVKNAVIGNNTKASHLSYIGDATLGNNINIGCGTITVNYDGKKKARTVIEDGAFVGCNSNLIAPVTVESNSVVAAGTTVTKVVKTGSLAIGRVRQENLEGWVRRD